ncbi:MFS transporter [Bradyrhizobium sp.]|uniref:MFS transporter n=1 Tax=Bradyrhizobium sp. TaxID=376 RepID=UPI002D5507FE|nr:MFS transporter [Bradyrhizobium sp.]HZR75682.1 MFS transporter [Bradyrhizobium sp.]
MQQGMEGLASIASDDERRLYRKVVWRIIPFIFVCYVLNYIDRVNVSFAKLQFKDDLSLTDASYGLGVGLFYVGYILFEVPSNLVLQKIGARKTIMRIMCLWGLTSMATAFVSSPLQFYLARIVLGAAEAGFFPGIILYLTLWFPDRMRGRIMSYFVLAIAASGTIGGPISGVIMQNLGGLLGLKNWQWLFLIEGMLPVVMGIAAFFVLNDRPRDAVWLSDREKDLLIANLKVKGGSDSRSGTRAFLLALRKPMLWVATSGYFSVTWAGMVLNFWSPTIIQRAGVTNLLHVGLLSAVPYMIGAAGMLVFGYHSDRRLERHWHFFAAVAVAGCAAIAIAFSLWNSALSVACLAVLAIGYLSATALFWTIPTGFLSERESAGSIAFISSAGQIGSLIAPVLFGYVSVLTGDLRMGACLVALVLFGGGSAVVSLKGYAKSD